MRKILSVLVVIMGVAVAGPGFADDVAFWNNTNSAGGSSANVGKALNVSGASTHFWSGIGLPNGQQAMSNDGWDSTSDNWWVDVVTTGYSSITVSSLHIGYYDASTGERSPRNWKMQYDCGSGWVDSGATVAVATNIDGYNYRGQITNHALPAACANRASVKLRWMPTNTTSIVSGTINTNSNASIDEIFIRGTLAAVAPTDITLSNNQIPSSAGANYVVGNLTTTDANTADTFAYSLVSGTGSTDNAKFNINGNQLRINASLTAGNYSVRINTFDGTFNFSKAFTIIVTDYPAISGSTQFDFISAVVLNTINSTTGAAAGGYSDFSTTSTSLTRGQSYTIYITSASNEPFAPYYSRAYIDWNHDKDFDDSGEMVQVQNGGGVGSYSASFVVPATAPLGNARLRVVLKQGGQPPNSGSIGDGEAEDYTINVLSASVCGNGAIEPGEACDDGDTSGSDGCSATCTVESGWSCNAQSPTVCVDINECTNGTNNCNAHATCTNTPGSFTCACNAGYWGSGTACTACAPGTANPLAGQTTSAACVACAVGYYAPSSASSACSACAAGSYAGSTGATSCSQCLAGYFSTAAASSCSACAAGTYSSAGASSCTNCSAGTYAASSGSASCTACAPGSYSTVSGATACTLCPAGSYNPLSGASSAEACLLCAKGFFSNVTGSASCQPCSAGTFAGSLGSTGCTPCAPGTYGPNVGAESCIACAAGTANPSTGATAAGACAACLPGSYADLSGSSACSLCLAGTFNPKTGSSTKSDCQLCPAGSYNPDEGSGAPTDCRLCAPGSASAISGAVSADACVLCPVGSAAPSPGTDVCVNCEPGSFAAEVGAELCNLCPEGFFNDAFGLTECAPCDPGSFSADMGSIECLPCLPGRFASASGAVQCDECAPGQFSPQAGAELCQLCAPGTYSDAFGAVECTDCQAGSFNPEVGRTGCMLCPPGTFADSQGLAFCEECSTGTFSDSMGTTQCEQCEAGSYASATGSTACALCGPGTYSMNPGASMCNQCLPGFFAENQGSVSCAACAEGQHAASPGSAACEDCLPGSYANVTGMAQCILCSPGSFAAVEAATLCTLCPDDTFAPESGSAMCLGCQDGFASSVGSATCSPVCGDGMVVEGEACDDGNESGADGCNSDCTQVQYGWDCPPAGGACTKLCTIDGEVQIPGFVNPANGCQVCDTAVSTESWTNLAQGAGCLSDGLDCTEDLCDGVGACLHTITTGCVIDGACVAEGSEDPENQCAMCNPAASRDFFTNKADGVECSDDGIPWTLDLCDAGLCSHTNTGNCVIDGVTFEGGSANPENGCQWCDAELAQDAWSFRADGFPCSSDELECTSDVCDGAGTCEHRLFTGCLVDGNCVGEGEPSVQSDCLVCDPALDGYGFVAKSAGAACADDGLPTTVDVCDGMGVCTHPANGSCSIGGIVVEAGGINPDNSCQACDAAVNAAAWTNLGADVSCAPDGLECTQDVCDGAGVCLHVLFQGCLIDGGCVAEGTVDPNNYCMECNPALSTSSFSPRRDGSSCADDGLWCSADICKEGVCLHEVFGACLIDGKCVTAGQPDTENGCQVCMPLVDLESWTMAGAGLPCADDGDPGTLDTCDGSGVCQHVADGACTIGGESFDAGVLNPENECQACLPQVDASAWSNLVQGAACADDGFTYTMDICDGAGLCTHESTALCVVDGVPYQMGDKNPANDCEICDPALNNQGFSYSWPGEACTDDMNPCTADVCSGDGVCQHPPVAASVCDDGNVCTDDSCDPALGCVNEANSGACDDGDLCTINDSCSEKQCQGGGALDCDDGNPCTADACVSATGCSHEAQDGVCDDGNACTQDDLCGSGLCLAGPAVDCDDGNPCTDDACDPETGCTHANNTLACDDGNVCTVDEVCSAGTCGGGLEVSCDDADPCTIDSCVAGTGCVNEPGPDTDEDGICDQVDNCPEDENTEQEDMDDDGIGDVCDPDRDGDDVDNEKDNCPDVANELQEDSDNNGVGDACEEPWEPNPEQGDDVVTEKDQMGPDGTSDPDVSGDAASDDVYQADLDGSGNSTRGSGGCASAASPTSNSSTAALLLLLAALLLAVRRIR